jgi:hypothetical protein
MGGFADRIEFAFISHTAIANFSSIDFGKMKGRFFPESAC